jgi:ankyrin repeat protein
MSFAADNRLSLPINALCAGLLLLTISFGNTILADTFEHAVAKNNMSGIEMYLDKAINIDYRGTNGKTALMIAAREGNKDLVDLLIERGADINAKNINDGTPLMFAAINGNSQIVSTLLDAGADPSATGTNGWGALMVAVAKGHEHTTRLLLNAGADINSVDIYLWTPLMRAAAENKTDVVSILLEADDINIDQKDDHGATALHHSAGNGNAKIVELLLLGGSNPRMTDDLGRTPADYATKNDHQELALLIRNL